MAEDAVIPVKPSRTIAIKLAIVLAVAGVTIPLVLLHVHGVNGPWYWTWPWRHLAAWPLYPLMALAAIPFFAGQWMFHRWQNTGLALALLTISTVALQRAAVSQQPHEPDRSRLEQLIDDDGNTSYYSAAVILLDQQQHGVPMSDWMRGFPELQEHKLVVHARYKPPGLILYHMFWIKVLGATAFSRSVAGAVVGLIGAAGVLTTYRLLRLFNADRDSSFAAASFFALIPSLILFFPQFDQAYVPLATVVIIAWVTALRSDRPMHAILFGVAFAGVLFLSYAFLLLGGFLAPYTLLHLGRKGRAGLEPAAKQCVISIATIAAIYLLLWLALDFNAIDVYHTASRLSQDDLVHLRRPFPLHLAFDVLDVLLATGWISAPLIVFGLLRLNADRATPFMSQDTPLLLAALGLLQVTLAIGVAVFPGENARLLLLLLPLLMTPIGAELARWPARFRIAVYVALLAVTIVIAQNMIFLHLSLDGRVP